MRALASFLVLVVVLAIAPLIAAADDAWPDGAALAIGPHPLPLRRPMRVVVGPTTPAMRVWVLRGAGPAHVRVLGPLAVELTADADDAIDRLEERALAIHADAVVRVQIEHGPGGVRVAGIAVRFASDQP